MDRVFNGFWEMGIFAGKFLLERFCCCMLIRSLINLEKVQKDLIGLYEDASLCADSRFAEPRFFLERF